MPGEMVALESIESIPAAVPPPTPPNGQIYLISQWEHPTTAAKACTVAVLLPSGVRTGMFSHEFSPNSKELIIKVWWPKPFTDIAVMQRKLFEDFNLEPGVLVAEAAGFNRTLREKRPNPNAPVSSAVRIPLPFAVLPVVDLKKI